MGKDFRPVLLALMAFGNRHFPPDRQTVHIVNQNNGQPVDPILVDPATGMRVDGPGYSVVTTSVEQSSMSAVTPIVAAHPGAISLTPAGSPIMSARTSRLLHGPIVPTLLAMAWPNVLVMLAQASTGLIETWWVSHLGTDALAGMALVFPGFMMMQMLSARRDGRRHFLGGRARARRRAARRRRCAGAACAVIIPGARLATSARRCCVRPRALYRRWAAAAARSRRRWPIPTWCSPARRWSG